MKSKWKACGWCKGRGKYDSDTCKNCAMDEETFMPTNFIHKNA